MSRTAARLALASAALVLTACGSPRRSEPLTGRFVAANDEVARGERVFMQHCHLCHPGGEAGLGPSLNDKPLPGFAIRTQVRAGLGAMPAFAESELPVRDVDALVAYLRARRVR